MKLPPLREMFARLISTPSVSSTNPALDRGNAPVTALLGEWLGPLGSAVELIPVAPGRNNLVATAGGGPGGLVLADGARARGDLALATIPPTLALLRGLIRRDCLDPAA